MRHLFLIMFIAAGLQAKTIVLSKDNTVNLRMPIMGDTAKDIQVQLMKADRNLGSGEPIYLTLYSPGGSVSDGEHIIETAKGLDHQVDTISIFSASMSFILSQYMGKRYVLDSGVMMSHRASANGLSGQIPGNLVTRVLGLLTSLGQIDAHVASRAGMRTPAYQALIANELWMRGQRAVDLKFADEVVTVTCDESLQGGEEPQLVDTGFFLVKVVWAKCPLITEPLSAVMAKTKEPVDFKELLRVYTWNRLRVYNGRQK